MKTLDPALAAKFIEKFSHIFENNINIMDQKGIIIGSKDKNRIGTFHEIAYSLIQGKNCIGDVTESDSYLGTKRGVNFCIYYKGKAIGVVGVSGKVEEVRPIGLIIKTAIETMLDYEFQLEIERQQHSRKEQFLYSVLYYEHYEAEKISSIASSLLYKADCIRIPILLDCHGQTEPHQLVSLLNQCEETSKQDMIAVLKNNLVLIYKYLPIKEENLLSEYKEEVQFYITFFLQSVKNKLDISHLSFFVGSLQNSFRYYKEGYQHASWLNFKIKENQGIFFFYDFVSDYLKGLLTIRVFDELFHTFNLVLTEEKQQLFLTVYDALIRHNYNVVTSAKELYIHRNTLLFRMNKMNELLNLDPISNYQDRELIRELVYYYKNKQI